jgi:Domain of unknown function (DUF397)
MTAKPAKAKLNWVKSSRSLATGACVELAAAGECIALRDSKNPSVAPLLFTRTEMGPFVFAAKRGEFDCLLDHTEGKQQH